MKKPWIILWIVLSLASAPGCQGAPPGGVPQGGAPAAVTPNSGALQIAMAKNPAPQGAAPGAQTVVRLPAYARATEPPIPAATPPQAEQAGPPASEPFRLCSPLVDDPLEKLPEIISDPYHPPPHGREERHHGVDFAYYQRNGRAGIEGAGVQSVLAGTAAAVVSDRFPYGNLVIVETPFEALPAGLAARLPVQAGQSLYVLYAHLQGAPLAVLNVPVGACQLLGAVGRSGNAGGAHLHLEARTGPPGQRFASLAYYKADATPDERSAYLRWRTGGEFVHFDPMLLLAPTAP